MTGPIKEKLTEFFYASGFTILLVYESILNLPYSFFKRKEILDQMYIT
ncbi:ABC transporter permease, partial [Leptospira borgpetersenii serovar Hardjo-bovis]|nr:ABC transporter permease [Leptospira borgpetersenii serovar Hardjo-bovis]